MKNDKGNFDEEEMQKFLRSNCFLRVSNSKDKTKRVIDMYGREEINSHLRRFLEHCVAKGINPELPVVLDWLYSEKAFNERDDFVKIERLMEMIKNGTMYPMLVMEVLEYAKKIEDVAISVVDDETIRGNDSVEKLREVLSTRLEVRRLEEEKEKETSMKRNGIGGILGMTGVKNS